MKGRATHILFCTTVIFLRRLLLDSSLQGVTHVIADEIHERGMNEGHRKKYVKVNVKMGWLGDMSKWVQVESGLFYNGSGQVQLTFKTLFLSNLLKLC
ncbi:putative RNA helicase [Helianthus annuus]|nr:putative RNA helicase [Helianthus annuus]KAJ0446867.1 putative RNA helicase [Helianthus annuus]KAJ0631762.1 putative RNA helicase [Helianthus annuus]